MNSLESDYVSALSAASASSNVITRQCAGKSHFLLAARIEGTQLIVCLAARRSTMLSASRTMLIVGIVLFWVMTFAMLTGINVAARAMRFSLAAMDSVMQEIAEGGGDLTAQA